MRHASKKKTLEPLNRFKFDRSARRLERPMTVQRRRKWFEKVCKQRAIVCQPEKKMMESLSSADLVHKQKSKIRKFFLSELALENRF
jgi:hypothetical protein